ncbi:MAG: dam [Candidatus Eremiobacteraeota bacterium]|nr:dam [Candidatus Eremiobacteraeota bacterium]
MSTLERLPIHPALPNRQLANGSLNGLHARPLLKWPGGKRFLARELRSLFPDRYCQYIEPFIGGGAIFFDLMPSSAIVGDANEDLMECYQAVRSAPDEVHARLSRLRNSKEDYYYIRSSKPRTALTRAARLIYLTTLSFNGIYRENQRGEFNVPYGNRPLRRMPTLVDLKAVSAVLRCARLCAGDFALTTKFARPGDLVYLDPPYPATSKHSFRKYHRTLFSVTDHERLALEARRLVELGCHVFVSNADVPEARKLYSGFKMIRIHRTSIIAASSSYRRAVTELVFANGAS